MKYLALLGLFISMTTSANYYCIGKVSYLGVSANGSVAVSNGNGVHYVCNTNQEFCNTWISFATAAKMTDREIAIYYESADISGKNPEACSNHGSWVTPSHSIYHIELE